MARDKSLVTTPDLVVLSLLAEKPMHGYEVNAELERRQARDWVAISRPQIYYSLEKLTEQGLLTATHDSAPVLGADRRVLRTSAKGRAALSQQLESENWTSQRDRPAFLTWLALSWQASPLVVKRQLRRRMKFLETEIEREHQTLSDVRQEVGHEYHEAVWMLKLTLSQLKSELQWVKQVARELPKRAVAANVSNAEAVPSGNRRRKVS